MQRNVDKIIQYFHYSQLQNDTLDYFGLSNSLRAIICHALSVNDNYVNAFDLN